MIAESVTVRQLNLYIRSMMEGDRHLNDLNVTGEISNFKNHFSSGHWYFTLKDRDAAVRCVMFRSNAARVKICPQDGMQVTVRGRVSVYEKEGQYQLYAEAMAPAGEGDIALEFERIKKKLEDEGLFDPDSKRQLPAFPRQIAVITSGTGAAVQDILNILGRRYPCCEVLLCPVAVQGENAVPEMLSSLDRVYALGTSDLIIIGRGGGSAEDLWAFNDEKLARKIYESPVPVISAVGHETDFSISDFAADLRAPTPSAAAELAVPDRMELTASLITQKRKLYSLLPQRLQLAESQLRVLQNSASLQKPDAMIERRVQQLDRLTERLRVLTERTLSEKKTSLAALAAGLDAMSPLKVLSRGYSVIQKDNTVVSRTDQLSRGDDLLVRLSDGSASCTVKEIQYVRKEN